MKQVMLFFVFSLLFLPMMNAQHHKGGEDKRENHQDRMTKIVDLLDEHVTLSNAQKAEIQTILEETTEQIKEMEAITEPQRNEIKAKIDEIRNSDLEKTEKKQKIKEIKDQYQPQISEFRNKLDAITSESKKRINDVLTVEQKAVMFEVLSERKQKNKGDKNKK